MAPARRVVIVPGMPHTSSRSGSIVTAIVAVVLVAFTAYTGWVVATRGLLGVIDAHQSRWGVQVFVDLVLACVIAIGFVLADARRRGVRAWPFVVLTALAGSIGLLGYLVWRGVRSDRNAARAANGGS